MYACLCMHDVDLASLLTRQVRCEPARVGQPCGWRLILQTGDSIHKDDGVDGVMVWMEGGGVDTMGRQGASAEGDATRQGDAAVGQWWCQGRYIRWAGHLYRWRTVV